MKARIRCRKNATIEERLRLHMIEAPSGCWIWTGAIGTNGYGRVQVEGRCGYAHRVSYETFVGPIPSGHEIDHLCRRRNCINPRHLQAVTPSVNVRRGTSPGARALRRDKCLNGHAYTEHGRVVVGRRICSKCRDERLSAYGAKQRDYDGAGLRAARKAAKLSQLAAGSLVGISQPLLSTIERNRADVTPDVLARLWALYAAPQERAA